MINYIPKERSGALSRFWSKAHPSPPALIKNFFKVWYLSARALDKNQLRAPRLDSRYYGNYVLGNRTNIKDMKVSGLIEHKR